MTTRQVISNNDKKLKRTVFLFYDCTNIIFSLLILNDYSKKVTIFINPYEVNNILIFNWPNQLQISESSRTKNLNLGTTMYEINNLHLAIIF